MNNLLSYPITDKKPLVIESKQPVSFNLVTYKRKLRISRFNAFMIDEVIGTNIGSQTTQFVFLDIEEVKKVCVILDIEFKNINTYFCIDATIYNFK